MSFWVHAYCNGSVSSVSTEDLKAGIGQRLARLTAFFCPEEEENPAVVLDRLRIENHSDGNEFQQFRIYYRRSSTDFIHVGRNDRSAIMELEYEVLPKIRRDGINLVKQMLKSATEDVAFCLKSYDVTSMGFPLVIAAAAYLVSKQGGLIQSGTYSWMVPHNDEVRIVLAVEA